MSHHNELIINECDIVTLKSRKNIGKERRFTFTTEGEDTESGRCLLADKLQHGFGILVAVGSILTKVGEHLVAPLLIADGS